MRRILLILVILVFIVPSVRGASPLGNPAYVNKTISINKTPQLEPGQKGDLIITLYNPYAGGDMNNVTLTASIYLYKSIDEERQVNGNWKWNAPYFEEEGRGMISHSWTFPTLLPGVTGQQNLTTTIVTSMEAPHGGILNQGSYFIRFELTFDFRWANGTVEHIVLKSRGHFTDEEWEFATRAPVIPDDPNYVGNINMTHLGVDGILPDTSFGILEPIPDWVFYGLIVVAVVAVVFAILFYLEENPEKWPAVARPWIRLRSSFKQSRRISKKKKQD